ncbi:response regulator [Desulfovibrio sp. OttesenSCG-928-G15]|nr:response regulator [Desulfovibrio sp. OttesenSCG-928-G15]
MTHETKAIVMAVDDDAVILNTVLVSLRGEYTPKPFTNGASALKFLENNHVDLILLDYMMPGMTGFDVLRELQAREKTRNIPVIVFTGTTSDDFEVQALEMGAVDFIPKPVKPRILTTRVRIQIELQAHRKNLERLVQEKTRSLNDAYVKLKVREDVTLNLLAQVTDLRDHDTGNHIERTTGCVRILVEDLYSNPTRGYTLTPLQAQDIVRSAKLHDLGKIATPDYVLLKPGKLSPEEFEVVKLHTVQGEQLLADFIRQMDDSFLTTAKDIAHSHHERWDGQGYPRGLKAEEIPLAARLVAIADVYDALISIRPYKPALSHEEACEIISKNSGTHFDPYLVTVFERNTQAICKLYENLDCDTHPAEPKSDVQKTAE